VDRTELSEAIIQEVSEILAEELRVVGPELLTVDLDGMEERLQGVSRRVYGATMERALAVRVAVRRERSPCPACGGLLRLADNATRMDYPRYVAAQLPIGSGAAESLCKTLIEAREKGAGMRWTRAGSQAVATLRAVRASGQWAAFWARYPLRERLRLRLRLRPRPVHAAASPLPLSSPLRTRRPC